MKLRTRLILAFLVLSVVPLGAVTMWSYRSNVKALQEAASHEADLLAGELSQRMQLVTSRLSERLGQLVDLSPPAPPTAVKVAPAAKPTPAEATPAGTEDAQFSNQVANALGEAALLLNNVDLPGMRSTFRAGPPPGGRGGRPSGPPDTGGRAPGTSSGRGPATRSAGSATVTLGPQAPTPPSAPGAPPAAGATPRPPRDPNRIHVDVSGIWRDLLKDVVPSGRSSELTTEQRATLMREVNQRLLGIKEGIKQSAVVLQRKADEARQKAEEGPKVPASQGAKVPAPEAKPVAAAPVTRKLALSGSRLDVSVEQNGEVLRKVNAEINLPNLLMTVFSAVGREQGEVPFAVGTDGHIYTPADEDRPKVEALGAVAKPDGPLGRTILPEWIVVTTKDPSGSGLRFGIARPVGDSLSSLRRAASLNAAVGLGFIGLAIVGIVPLSSRLTRNLTKLTDGVKRIAHGDYGARVEVKAHDEVGNLARAFNQMAADVESHQRAVVGQERIKRELELGRQIQHDMLPHEPLRLGLTEVQGVSVPAREVGGDFFNYFALSSGHVALLVGDVSGKGVGAALLMANIQASLRTRFALGQDLSAIAHAIDEDIAANSPGPMYATLFLGILDPVSRQMRYVNAGHHPQFVLRRGGGLERMSSTGIPVGLLPGHGYGERLVQLALGDLVFFYTDGCVDTENEDGDFFGTDRLERSLVAAGAEAAHDVLARVEHAMEQFRGARELFDDATMMAVRIG